MSEALRAPNYPEDVSQIQLSPMEWGMIDGAFDGAVTLHGNGDSFTWKSYADGDSENITVVKYGNSDAPLEETDYWQISKWILSFERRETMLLIDPGTSKVERIEGEHVVPSNFQDHSDIVAAYLNYHIYHQERIDQGYNPTLDYFTIEAQDLKKDLGLDDF